ncbi:MAG: hypothetical protein GY874_17405 [Desulfobacteraceae bacterium]|nr:hypothetical protein [Desulfobacteraceae bacterium]
MKKIFALIAVFTLLGCSTSKIARHTYDPGRIVHLNQYKTFKSPADINQHIAYLNPGDTIPLKLSVQSNLIKVRQNDLDLIVRKKIYFKIRFPEDYTQNQFEQLHTLDQKRLGAMSQKEKKALFSGIMFYISKNAIDWAPLKDQKALKRILDIENGSMGFGLAMNEKQGLWFVLAFELQSKDKDTF